MHSRSIVAIDQLLEDHRRVDAIIRQLEPMLDRDTAPVQPEFARLRWTLAREFTSHHAAEQAALGRATTRRGGVPTTHDHGLAAAFRAHMIEWGASAIQDCWPQYRHASRLLMHRMLKQMRHEETALFPSLR